MDILLNELSLNGQFTSENDFLDNLEEILPIVRIIEKLKFTLLKNYTFFNSKITRVQTLSQVMNTKDDRVRKLKSSLLKLSDNPPFWEEKKKHSCTNDSYIFNLNNVCDTSLAESCERDKLVLSFSNNDYGTNNLLVVKNSDKINIFNILDKNLFLDYIFSLDKITPFEYCELRFKNTNLNFTLLDKNNGFNLLNTTQIKEYISSFIKFSSMNWKDIKSDGGFQYKAYDGNWFNNTVHSKANINKFRITQKYRCFGYTKEAIFYVLRFEVNHKISD